MDTHLNEIDAHQTAGRRPRRRMPMHTRILIGLAVGLAAGLAANSFLGEKHPAVVWSVTQVAEPVGQLFLRLLLMTVVPLVFGSLVSGVAAVGDVRTLGRVGFKTFAFTLVVSAVSVAIGLGIANTVRPGDSVTPEVAEALSTRYGAEAAKRIEAATSTASADAPLLTVVKTIVPANPIAAVASETPNMLHLMFFALLLGVAATLIPGGVAAPLVAGCEALAAASSKIIDLVMAIAPVAVACLIFANIARFGPDLLVALSWFIGAVLVGLAIHMFVVYSVLLRAVARVSPLDFFRAIRTAMLTAFSTSSSNATLPTALRAGEERLGIPREINTFVLTIGATANQNGTALYEGVTVLFLAQLAGVDLALSTQIMVAYLAILGGIGTAGVPAGSIPFVIIVLQTVGVDPALIAIVFGVDRILDMCRTTLNVAGDLAAAACVARSEGFPIIPQTGSPAVAELSGPSA